MQVRSTIGVVLDSWLRGYLGEPKLLRNESPNQNSSSDEV